MKKTVAILTIMSALLFTSYAEEIEDSFDSIFEEENDIETPLVTITNSSSSEKKDIITFSGKLSSDLGFAYIYNPLADETDLNLNGTPKNKIHNTGMVFTLTNDFYINARPSDIFNIKADIKTTFKDKFELSLNELYFTYNPYSFLYISAGKKATTWGNVKLLKKIPAFVFPTENPEKTETHSSEMNTNILNDISNKLTFQIVVPWSTGSFTFLSLYDYSNIKSDFSYDDMSAFGINNFSFAASLEQTLFHTNINLFARLYDGRDSETKTLKENYINPIVGIELKKTVADFDFYVQNLLRIVDSYDSEATSSFEKEVFTFGMYNQKPFNGYTLGINTEYQYQLELFDDKSEHIIAILGGISDFGPSKGLKIGANWNHKINEESGDVGLIFQVSKLIPYVTVKTGVKTEYNDEGISKVSSGVTFSLSGNY